MSGTAKLVITELDVQMVDLYVQYIRPVQIANKTSKRLLVLSGGHNFNKFNQRSKQIFHHFGLKLISATRSRKLAAATKLDPKDNSLMTAMQAPLPLDRNRGTALPRLCLCLTLCKCSRDDTQSNNKGQRQGIPVIIFTGRFLFRY